MSALVSVVIPVYNAAPFLAEAIESILNQTFSDFELIVIDDGSKDDSLTILNHYASVDPRINVISRENRGLIATLNEGIALSKGEFIARMDGDDICLPTRFEKQVSYLKSHLDCVAVGTLATLIDVDGDLICPFGDWLSHDEIDGAHIRGQGGAIIHPSAMIRRQSIEAIGGYSEDYPHAEDLDLWLRLAETGQLANLPERLVLYRQHTNSIGYAQRQSQIESATKAVADACKRRDMSLATTEMVDRKTDVISSYDIYIKWGWWALKGGNLATCKKYAKKAILAKCFKMEAWKLLACSIRGH